MMDDCNILLVFKSALFHLSCVFFFRGQWYYFHFWMIDMMNICISFSDILLVLHSHNVGVINLSLVIINPRVSL